MFIKYEAEVSSSVGSGERGVVDFGKFFTETNEQKFSELFSCHRNVKIGHFTMTGGICLLGRRSRVPEMWGNLWPCKTQPRWRGRAPQIASTYTSHLHIAQ